MKGSVSVIAQALELNVTHAQHCKGDRELNQCYLPRPQVGVCCMSMALPNQNQGLVEVGGHNISCFLLQIVNISC